MDFILHTAVIPCTLLEGCLGEHVINIGRNLKYISMLLFCYSLGLIFNYTKTGSWPYSVLAKLGVSHSILILVPAFIFIAVVGMTISKFVSEMFSADLKSSMSDMNHNGIKLVAKKAN